MTDHVTLLAVDDASESLALLVKVLTAEGYRVRAADSGELALAAVAADPPDLILLDVRMPDVSGLDVCRRLKAREETRRIPIILMSAFADAKEWVEGLQLGAADYITKPFQIEELLTRVKTHLALALAHVSLQQRAADLRQTNEQLRSEIGERRRVEEELRQSLDRAECSRRAMLSTLEDQQQAEASLLNERELYVDLVNSQPAGIYRLRVLSGKRSSEEGWRNAKDPPYTVELVSDRFCELLKVEKKTFETNPGIVNDLVHDADRAEFARRNVEANSHLIPFVWEGRVIVGGELRWVHFESHPRLMENGDVLWTGILYDITDGKRAEAERERLTTAIEQASEVVFITDPLGIIQYVNPAFERTTGYSRAEAVGQTPRILKSGKQSEAFYRELWETIASGKTWQGRTVNKRKDGTLYTEESTVSPVCDAAGRIVNYVAVKHDITEELRLADQLQQAQKMESVGRLAGGVAHDFNNMLGVILGYAEMAIDRVDASQPLHADLVEIRKAATRSADLTQQLLAFARKQTVAPKVLDLNETVTGTLKMLQRLIGEGISLVWLPGADLWPVKVDPSQIDQILANLCINVRDAIASVGKVTIETGRAAFDEAYCADHPGAIPGEFDLLAVSDDGCGMDKETLAHIFEPFFTTKGVGEGTGLGLATVYGIVRQNDGFIDVSSAPDLGTTFKIYLPRHSSQIVRAPGDGAAEPARRGHETILLVEDEQAILKLTTTMLERQGYTLLAASTPGEAIRLAREHAGQIHLLMTDVVMPEMNGRDLAKNLLSLYPSLKRLFMSGYTAEVIVHQGVLNDGVHFLQKPFSMKELTAGVRAALDSE